MPLSAPERRFVDSQRIGRLATADKSGAPHVVPVCFGLADDRLYITIDRKPKRDRVQPLKRLSNIAANPQTAIVFDRYDEDWRRLAWVMLRGRAEILTSGAEHDRAQALLRSRYGQYAAMPIEELPVIAIHIERVTSWGDLSMASP
jgi:PPOX class probable F420-dependent enzyme